MLAPAAGVLEESAPVVAEVASPATAAATSSSLAATIPKAGLLGGGQTLIKGAGGGGGGSKPPSPTEEKPLESKPDPVKQKSPDVRQRGKDILDIFAEGQGQATREGLEADVEAQQGVKTAKKPGGAPQPQKFDVGNFAHDYAEDLISKDELPGGLDKEVEVRLPDGGTKRLDRVDRANGKIYEIKPNTQSQVAAGRRQLKLYIEYMNKEQPLGGGRTWQGKVVTYNKETVVRLLKRIGWLE